MDLEAQRRAWSKKTFDSTPLGSLAKVQSETLEVKINLMRGIHDITEHVDLIMAAFDVMMRDGFSLEEFKEAYENKLKINMVREWKKNKDGSYSHVKNK